MKRLLIGLALLALVACGGSQTATKTSPTASQPPAAAATPAPAALAPQIFKPGDQIQISNTKDGTRVLLTVGQPAVIKPGKYDSEAKNGEYLGVPITIENQGATPFNVSSMIGFDLRDQDGQGYNTTYGVGNAPKAPDGEVAPTLKLAGTLIYDVAPGKAYQLLFKANFLSSGQAIVNLGQF
jgi:hypothetical protein